MDAVRVETRTSLPQGGGGVIYIISENTAHCALCVLPANTVRSCLCAAGVQSYSRLRAASLQQAQKAGGGLLAETPPPNVAARPAWVCARWSDPRSGTDTTQKRAVWERHLAGA